MELTQHVAESWNIVRTRIGIGIAAFWCIIYIMNPYVAAALYFAMPAVVGVIGYLFRNYIFAELKELGEDTRKLVASHIRHEEQTKHIIRSVDNLSNRIGDVEQLQHRNTSRLAQIAAKINITFMQE